MTKGVIPMIYIILYASIFRLTILKNLHELCVSAAVLYQLSYEDP